MYNFRTCHGHQMTLSSSSDGSSHSHIGVEHKLRPMLMRPRFRWVGSRRRVFFYPRKLLKMVPSLRGYVYKYGVNNHPLLASVTTSNRFKSYYNFTNLNHMQSANLALSKSTAPQQWGLSPSLYRSHPRWTSKLEKVWPFAQFGTFQRLIGQRVSKFGQGRYYSKSRSWLRNAGALY